MSALRLASQIDRKRWRGLAARLGLIVCGLAGPAAAELDRSASHGALNALLRNQAQAPERLLTELRQLAPTLPADDAMARDLARHLEIRLLLDTGAIRAAEALALETLADPARTQDAAAQARAKLNLLGVRLRQSRIADAQGLAAELRSGRAGWRNTPLEADYLYLVGTALSRAQSVDEAASFFAEGMRVAERDRRPEMQAYVLVGLCGLNHTMKNPDKALQYCRQAIEIAERDQLKLVRAAAAINFAWGLAQVQQPAAAKAELRLALKLARELKMRRAEAMARINLAELAMTEGDWKAAAEQCRAGILLGRELGDPIMVAVAQTNLGTSISELGDPAQGVRLYQQGLAEAEQAGERAYIAEFLPGLIRLQERAGQLGDALASARRLIELNEALFQTRQAEALAQVQSRFDAERKQREIDLLKLDNELKSVALERHGLQRQVQWLVGAILALSAVLLTLAYRRVQRSNRQLKAANFELEYQSAHDPLTGLFNRRALDTFFQIHSLGRRKPGQLPPLMALVLLDIDHFKKVNDSWGHEAGDAVLREIARRLSLIVRPDDRAFRLGGEEFLLILPEVSGAALAALCLRLLKAIAAEPVRFEGQPIPVSISIGACHYPLELSADAGFGWKQHLRLADLALYQSKGAGRNCAHQVSKLREPSAASLAHCERDWRGAVAAGVLEVSLLRQPAPA